MLEFMEINCEFTFSHRNVERVGAAYLNSKRYNANTQETTESNDDDSTDKLPEEFAVDVDYLKSLDPKEWKDHDHYAILGLGKLRFNATDDDIRRAYRRMVLMHHPDKRKAKGEDVNTDDDYFTCITKAYEILVYCFQNAHIDLYYEGNTRSWLKQKNHGPWGLDTNICTSKTRRAYDSVDPEFDDSFPTQSEIDNNIYGCFNKCFDLNARWSEKRNVPKFGDESSTREQVEEFYSFWYEFKSWREFSYLDEEDKEKGQDRDERRWIEKENKALRIKRKKEEMMRIRALVDLAYNNDKRIQKFKNEEKERKLAAKRAKMDAAQAQKAEQERALREAQLAKERAEKAEQKRIEQIRIEKEQMKKALKKERKMLRDKLKESKYYGNNDKETLKNMEGVEKICETFNMNELQELNKEIEKKGQNAFFAALKTCERKIAAELEEINNQTQQKKSATTKNDIKDIKKTELWNDENMQLLIKSVNLFPAGTSQRWDVIAAFINQHSTSGVSVNARDVLNKAKAMQNSDFSKSSLKTQANNTAFENFNKSKKDVQTCNDITVNQPPVSVTNKIVNHTDGGDANKTAAATAAEATTNGTKEDNDKTSTANTDTATKTTTNKSTTTTPAAAKIWTKEEQALLEQAIKTYPISTPDRWDRIAECIPNRSKKDCLRRVKELVELVNSKKEAQQAVK